MAEPSSHINYSFEDIQRYLNGSMSAAEMHDIEKAALQDPFLADAIEGFNKADFTKAQQHINEINASLLKEKKQSKVVAFNKKTRLLNIAAVVIVLAGIGIVLSYVLSSSPANQQTEIAKVEQKATSNSSNDNASSLDTATLFNDKQSAVLSKEENKKSEKDQSLPARKDASKLKAGNDADELNPGSETAQNETEAASLAAAPSATISNEPALISRSYASLADTNIDVALQGKVSGVDILPFTFSGKVMDETNKPIAGVTVASDDKKVSTLTDINGNFNLQQTDTFLYATASTVGYNTKDVVLQNNAKNEIILQPNSQALNEIVVTGYGAANKKTAKLNSLNNNISDSAKPVGGWKNFNNYIVTELSKDTANFSNNEDLVELEFLVDKTGHPYDITVTKSLSEQHSSKAKALLENGPKWVQPSKKKKAKVVINF